MNVVIEILFVALALYLFASIWAPRIRPYWRTQGFDARRLGTLSIVGATMFFGTPAAITVAGPPEGWQGAFYVAAVVVGLTLTAVGYVIDRAAMRAQLPAPGRVGRASGIR